MFSFFFDIYNKNIMNKCLNCGKETNNNKFCSISCQNKSQGKERADKRYGLLKKFTVKCCKCGKEIITEEREKLFPQKQNYHCSRSCANMKEHSIETKEKIRKTLLSKEKTPSKNPNVKIICKNCGKEFEVKYGKRKQMFCSKVCSDKFIRPKRTFKIKLPNDIHKKTFIYSLEYPIGNIKYIGKSDNPEIRLKNHLKEAKQKNKSYKDKWINSLPEKPFLNIIEETNYGNWQNREIYWIKFYKDNGSKLVNGTDGGEGSNGFLGKKHSNETKEILSKVNKGKKYSEEKKEKFRGENNGRCRLKDIEIKDILYMFHEKNIAVKEIAKKYNISKHHVFDIASGKKRKKAFDEYRENRFK